MLILSIYHNVGEIQGSVRKPLQRQNLASTIAFCSLLEAVISENIGRSVYSNNLCEFNNRQEDESFIGSVVVNNKQVVELVIVTRMFPKLLMLKMSPAGKEQN